jgi:hypothetical protein
MLVDTDKLRAAIAERDSVECARIERTYRSNDRLAIQRFSQVEERTQKAIAIVEEIENLAEVYAGLGGM